MERPQGLVFGEVADVYDDVRPGYPASLVDAVLAAAGSPEALVEVGAGTGKATAAFVGYGRPITCVEPDPAMAAVLRARFAGEPLVSVRRCTFEEWRPPEGGVPLLYSAQAWHWMDPETRWAKAAGDLSPGGTLAVFWHMYAFADADLEAALRELYGRLEPHLLDDPAGRPEAQRWAYQEMRDSGLYVDVEMRQVDPGVVTYPSARYRALVGTYSHHRILPDDRRTALLDGIEEVVARYGGTVGVRLETVLVTGRRPG